MESGTIDFPLLKSLLLVARKKIEDEVLRLLEFDRNDEDDVKVVNDLMKLLHGTGCKRYYPSFKAFSAQNMEKYLIRFI